MAIRIPLHLRPTSITEVNKAWTRVWSALENLGFACPRLESCQVYLGIIHTAYGYRWFGDRPYGRACGDIVLPSVSFSRWRDYFSDRPNVSVVDVLRHEYGHAYADVNRRRIESKRFEKAFGSPHDIAYDGGFEYDAEHHITEYATESTGEDFAEVFWKFLKHKGRLPRQHHTTPIIRKWEFVESLRRY